MAWKISLFKFHFQYETMVIPFWYIHSVIAWGGLKGNIIISLKILHFKVIKNALYIHKQWLNEFCKRENVKCFFHFPLFHLLFSLRVINLHNKIDQQHQKYFILGNSAREWKFNFNSRNYRKSWKTLNHNLIYRIMSYSWHMSAWNLLFLYRNGTTENPWQSDLNAGY